VPRSVGAAAQEASGIALVDDARGLGRETVDERELRRLEVFVAGAHGAGLDLQARHVEGETLREAGRAAMP